MTPEIPPDGTPPTPPDEFERLLAAWPPARPAEVDPEDTMWRWIAERMDAPAERPTLVPRAERRRALPWLGAAAAVVLVVGGALVARSRGFWSGNPAHAPAPPTREL